MVGEDEVRRFRDELEELIAFISDFGKDPEPKEVGYASDLIDALTWVLGEVPTERFRSSDFVNIRRLQQIIRSIEKKTGKSFEEYRAIPPRTLSEEQFQALIAAMASKSRPRYRRATEHLIRRFKERTGKDYTDPD
jgi:hypothetical protein